jgi:hypothetical protein
MTSIGSHTSYPEQSNTWQLPEIVNVEAKRVRYDPPKQFWVNRAVLEVRDGLELLIQLTHSLPVRALSPALYVGNTPIADYELAGPNLYRFFVIDPGSLEPGAAISLGWPQLPDMKRNLSNFRFQIRGNGNGLA